MKLVDVLREDLLRSYSLEVGGTVTPRGFKFWRRLAKPRFMPVLLVRLASSAYHRKMGGFAKLFSFLNYRWFGIEVGVACEIGPGLYLPHTMGTVIGATKIGSNAMIYQGVTLGAKELDIRFTPDLRPTLGDNVTVGAGAKVLGGISIGDSVTVGANAVVTSHVMSRQTVVGIPARPISVGNKSSAEPSVLSN